MPQLLVVLNQIEREERDSERDERDEKFMDFLQHTEWKAARCLAAPHLPGQGVREMLQSDAAADLGRRRGADLATRSHNIIIYTDRTKVFLIHSGPQPFPRESYKGICWTSATSSCGSMSLPSNRILV